MRASLAQRKSLLMVGGWATIHTNHANSVTMKQRHKGKQGLCSRMNVEEVAPLTTLFLLSRDAGFIHC